MLIRAATESGRIALTSGVITFNSRWRMASGGKENTALYLDYEVYVSSAVLFFFFTIFINLPQC